MQRHQLEHIIRAASAITDRYEIVVVGSQSILGSVPCPPAECTVSMEADVFPLGAEELSDVIDGAIGEGSPFHDTFGYYAQGVDSTTSILPAGWLKRVVRIQSEGTNGRVGYCLDPTDLFLAKCAANREKDRVFNLALLRAGIVNPEEARTRASEMPLTTDQRRRLLALVVRLAGDAHAPIPAPSLKAGGHATLRPARKKRATKPRGPSRDPRARACRDSSGPARRPRIGVTCRGRAG